MEKKAAVTGSRVPSPQVEYYLHSQVNWIPTGGKVKGIPNAPCNLRSTHRDVLGVQDQHVGCRK